MATQEKLEGLRALKARLSAKRVNGALRAATNRSGRLLRAEVRRLAPVDTGRLRRSIGVRFVGEEAGLMKAIVESTGLPKPWDRWTEWGTGIYAPGGSGDVIRPKRGFMMVFYWKRMGYVARFHWVRGQPAKFYFKRAYSDAKDEVLHYFNAEIRNL